MKKSTNTEELITLKEGYEIMMHMLDTFYEFTGSEDLTDILSGGEYLADGEPADSAFWDYWVEARIKLLKEGPLKKTLK